jgi:dolichol-phosphate mannosyltransferase
MTEASDHQPSRGSEPGDDLGPVLVVIPTYNERDNLGPIVGRLQATLPTVQVLVVDDGSPDGTGEIADKMAIGDDRVHVMHRTQKAGLGAAYIAGFQWALDRDYQVIVEMDADGSHAPEDLPRLLERLRTADLVLGSRYVTGGKVVNWPKRREYLSRGANFYARMVLGSPIHDITGGFRAYRRKVLETLKLGGVASQGYCFQVDLAWRTAQSGFTVAELPITFTDREIGESKMDSSVMSEAFTRILQWGIAHRTNQIRKLFGGK